MKRLAIVSTHPIQYNAPLYKLISQRGLINLKVFYTLGDVQQYDSGFAMNINWDIPLLQGYDFVFLRNKSTRPSSANFLGIINPDLILEIKQWRPDAILIYGWNYYSHLHLILTLSDKFKLWFRGDSTLIDARSIIRNIFRKIILFYVYRHIDKAFHVGTNNKKYFLKYGLNKSRLIFAPHAIDNLRFNFNNKLIDNYQQAQNWRTRLGYKLDEIVITFIGKFQDKKNPLLLADAIIKFNTTYVKKIKLLFVGNGPLENILKKAYSESQYVNFLPFQNQSLMPIVYLLGDIFCLPSKGPGETWGLSVNEAMSCGLPILVSNKCGCAIDLVEDGFNGYIFISENQTDLIKKLELLANSNLKLFGLRSTQIIESWSLENQCKTYENALLNM